MEQFLVDTCSICRFSDRDLCCVP